MPTAHAAYVLTTKLTTATEHDGKGVSNGIIKGHHSPPDSQSALRRRMRWSEEIVVLKDIRHPERGRDGTQRARVFVYLAAAGMALPRHLACLSSPAST